MFALVLDDAGNDLDLPRAGAGEIRRKPELLDQHQRIEEVAKMLSGDKLTDAALANARELMTGE